MTNNNKLFILETRKVTHKGKTSVFTAGDVVTEIKLRRVYDGRIPSWAIPATAWQALIIANNNYIDTVNREIPLKTLTEDEQAKVSLVEEHLLNLGFTRDSFSFVSGASQVYKDSDTETVWIGVKMETENDAFVGANKKAVSMTLNNHISINTFLQRVGKGQSLFAHNNF